MNTHGIAVIGRRAVGVQLLDGQTVKTNVLYQELSERYPERTLICVDTYQYSKHILSILYHTVQAFVNCEHIFVLLSRNGRALFFPILMGLNCFFHRRLYHDVIGGVLPGEVRSHPALRKYLNRFEVNWVEFDAMKQELEQLGVKNVEVLPNFKRLHLLTADQLQPWTGEPFVFTMFSRVTKEKGIGEAASAIAAANQHFGMRRTVLYIYGPVELSYQAEFDAILEANVGTVFYCGCVPYEESVEALRRSFMLLFPSTYPGEGVPGTLIDAFSAGVPVIATDWHYNAQFVESGRTGYCYPWQQPEQLLEYIIYAVEHASEIDGMRPACLTEAQKYTPAQVMAQICRRIDAGKPEAGI